MSYNTIIEEIKRLPGGSGQLFRLIYCVQTTYDVATRRSNNIWSQVDLCGQVATYASSLAAHITLMIDIRI